ncbi:MAG: phenylalanine--tRNA ligase subunit beta [Tenuifilaceae bacterium]
MKISYSWLKEYINIDIEPEKVAKILTSIGLEVESLEKIQAVKGGLEGVIIGEVLTCEKHPDADKLSKTTVNIGNGEPLHIVCGAPNVAKGQKVAVATVGTKLYLNDQEITIKKAKIRGELSEGMICAEDELGLGVSHAGIMVLDPTAIIGTPAKEYFKIEDDYLFEIGLTPNRIDAASHFGVARDLAAFLNLEKPTKAIKPSVEDFKIDNNNLNIPVLLENPEACTRYSGITISNIKVGPSPDWLKKKLKSIGLNPINNVVDVTNFILQEIGQPLHAFDADYITGNKVVVKTIKDSTPFITLDGVERKLTSEDLMICNSEHEMCIAGVFGGLHSGVTESTTKVFIESACFNSISVRKTARRFGLSTDASFRFERGADPNITIWALKRAALLIKEVAGGEISSEIVDVYPNPVEDFMVEYNLKNTAAFIGKEIPLPTIKKIFEGLEIKIVNEDSEKLQLAVPPYRVDVRREADVVEDVLRIYGYNNVEFSEKVSSTLSYSKKPDTHQIINLVSDHLSSNGFNEIMCNSLTKSVYYKDLLTFPAVNTVQILNPLSNDLNGMRQTLMFGGLESVQRNINHRNLNLKLYEFGNCYKFIPDADRTKKPLNSYSEDFRLGIWISGEKTPESWVQKPQQVNFFTIKGYVHSILNRFGFDADTLNVEDAPGDIFDYGLTYIHKNKPLVSFGLVNQNLRESFDLKAEVFFAEIKWSLVLEQSLSMKITYKELPKFPEVRRDLALLLDQNITYDQIRKIAFATERKLLKQINLFDVYQGKNLGENKKSYAVSFILLDENKTLNDIQIDKTMANLIAAFEKEVGAQIR